jgi:hypothetical protein
MAGINFNIGQVIETIKPTQFDKFKDKLGNELPPGTIRVRLRKTETGGSSEAWASPADPTNINVPIYGEQVLCFSAVDGRTEDLKTEKMYYTGLLNAHGQVNNTIMPYIQDAGTGGSTYSSDGISIVNPGQPPEQISFEEKDIVTLQPFQGDILRQDRFGSALRFSSTHLNLGKYKNKPFWKGAKAGDPFVALTCGMKGEGEYYTIEDPNEDKSFIYLTTTQKITKYRLAQAKIGDQVAPIGKYSDSQIIINSNRLVLNSKKDEIVLIAKKDVKVATPKWQVDMDAFFTLFDELLGELQKTGPGMPNQYIVGIGLSIGNPLLMAAAMKLKSKLAKMKQ